MSKVPDSNAKTLIKQWKQKDLKELWGNIKDFNDVLFYGSENGLFFDGKGPQGGNMSEYSELKNCLASARKMLEEEPPNLIDAAGFVQDFSRIFNLAERKRGLWWRINHHYGIFHWLFLTLSPFILWYAVISQFPLFASLNLVNAVFWGGMGGVAQGYYWLWQRINDQTFRTLWWFWALSLPFGGAIFGGMAYLLLTGGIASISTGNINEPAAVFFAALAGFNWKGFVDFFSNLWKQVKTKGETE